MKGMALGAGALALPGCAALPFGGTKLPNIFLFVIDDMSWMHTSFAGCRFVKVLGGTARTLEAFGGIRAYFDDDSADPDEHVGFVLDVRFFFTRDMFASLSLVTGEYSKTSGTFGYSHDGGLEVELEVGEDESLLPDPINGDFIRAKVGFRF